MNRRNVYASDLFMDQTSVKDDGTEIERFRVLIPEDVVKAIWKHHQCREYHDLAVGCKGTCLDAVIEDLGLQPEVSLLRLTEEIPQRTDNTSIQNEGENK